MKGLEVFKCNEFGALRIVDVQGKTMFVASDVAKILGYEKPANAISAHCKYALKWGIPHPQGKGTLQVNIIPEGDVYRLIIHSKLPVAEEFERWVFDKVVPIIRKNGNYDVNVAIRNETWEKTVDTQLLNARNTQAKLWLKIAKGFNSATGKATCSVYAANSLAGSEVFNIHKTISQCETPKEIEERTYTAKEVGERLGISAKRVGRIANEHHLQTEENGERMNVGSSKQKETYRYNEKGINAVRMAGQIKTRRKNDDGTTTTITPIKNKGIMYEVASTSMDGELLSVVMKKQ